MRQEERKASGRRSPTSDSQAGLEVVASDTADLDVLDGGRVAMGDTDMALFDPQSPGQESGQGFIGLPPFRGGRNLDLEHAVECARQGRPAASRHDLDDQGDPVVRVLGSRRRGID